MKKNIGKKILNIEPLIETQEERDKKELLITQLVVILYQISNQTDKISKAIGSSLLSDGYSYYIKAVGLNKVNGDLHALSGYPINEVEKVIKRCFMLASNFELELSPDLHSFYRKFKIENVLLDE